MSIFRATPHRVGALLALLYLALLLATAGDLAMSRDESFYVLAADRYAEWFRVLAQDPSAARSKELIDRFWVENHEHPPLMKSLFALSHLAQERWSIFPRPSDAYRFPGMLSAALLLWLIVVFGSRLWNLRAGVMAAIFFATLPRVFYHAHLNCFDVPIVLMILWVTYAYWRSLERPRWALMAGIAYGFALATKHNSWVLPGVLFIHWLWVLVQARWARRQGREMRVHLFPWWLLAMAALGPPLFLGSWPWLWHEPWPRFQAYAAFHLHHDYYNMAYFGRNYFEPPFPISYPFVMTAFTLPLTTLLLMLVGLGMRARALLPEPLALRLWPRGLMRSDARASDVLLLGSALAPLLIIALPSTPIFGGTKHWFPAYPFLALYAGYAADAALRAARARAPFTWMSSLPRFEARARAALPSILALLFCAPGVAESAHSHPFGLSHYTLLAGGVPGAADLGMNRQFWGFTTGSLAGWFREHLPQGGKVWICDTTWDAWRMMQQDGMLPPNIVVEGQMDAADYVIVHHEHHFAEVDYQAWVAFGSVKPVHILAYDGVPIISVYENPRRTAARR